MVAVAYDLTPTFGHPSEGPGVRDSEKIEGDSLMLRKRVLIVAMCLLLVGVPTVCRKARGGFSAFATNNDDNGCG